MKSTTLRSCTTRRHEAGQVMLLTVLGLAVFLIGAIAFAIDLSNMWFHRQSAQTASDAACTAAAMDMLVGATNGAMPTGANFTPAAANTYDCSTASPAPAPCSYASLNGYSSSISQSSANSGTIGDNVFIDFNTAANAANWNLGGLSLPPAATAGAPLVRVRVTSNIPTWFAGMLKGMTKQSTGATSICAVMQATSPIPILVLNPTVSGAINSHGTPAITIIGGPSKSIQVNSCATSGGTSPCASGSAVSLVGNAQVNLCAAGGNYCGSSMGVWGSESILGGFYSSPSTCTSNRPSGAPACTGSQQGPQWNSPSAPIADPLAGISAPSVPSITQGAPTVIPAGSTTAGCPDPSGCYEYAPGYYPNGICVGKGGCTYKTYTTAIFDPGIYYVLQGFSASSNSCIRPSNAPGDGSGGTLFYFADTNSISVGSNSGSCGSPIANFSITTGSGSLANGVKCTSTSQIPSNLASSNPTGLSGSVLLAPCQTPTVATFCASANSNANCSLNFGDPLGATDPNGEQRGVLFFQNRAVNAGSSPTWGGGGSSLAAGTIYFHQCVTSGNDTGQGCSSSAFNDVFNLGGGSGSSTYVLGDIITDQLSLGGNSSITMDLNPSAAYTTLKAALVQ